MGIYDLDAGSVDSRLRRWGAWKMQSGVALGFPSQSAFMRLVPAGDNHDRFGEIDHECIETNDAVELLPLIPQVVIRVEYVLAYSSVAVKAHQCGVCKRSYHNYLADAKKMFANILNKNLRVVHDYSINPLNCSSVRPQTV
ncbi:hypothetical protein [Nitrosomonas oligotropha]|uniref:hypothetical protein n=1 Tax=Nitrosomonas oligotropha TaxID=42354 RepID=UPI00136E7EC6|nr:hypothetical protein [Nitrosomonas oligotropha]MXS81561.1 hypothetical protein [Nitrosomonas oligotropha]